MDGILAVAKRHGLRVLEDAAQAHGASWRDQGVGGVGDLGSFSFQSSKNLNAGEGGAVCTNDQELAELTWSVMNVGRLREGAWYQHERLGWNYRLSEFHGALLRAQLTRVPEQMAIREANARYLDTHLAEIPGIAPQYRPPQVTGHAHHLYMLRYDKAAFGDNDRAAFIKALNAEGIPLFAGLRLALPRAERGQELRAGHPAEARKNRRSARPPSAQYRPHCPRGRGLAAAKRVARRSRGHAADRRRRSESAAGV